MQDQTPPVAIVLIHLLVFQMYVHRVWVVLVDIERDSWKIASGWRCSPVFPPADDRVLSTFREPARADHRKLA